MTASEPEDCPTAERGQYDDPMAEAVFVLAPNQNHFFFELAAALRYELEGLGVATSLSTTGFPELHAGRAYILLPPHEYYVLEGYAAPPAPATVARTILICAEQPGTVHFEQNRGFARDAAAVFDINVRSVRAFTRHGIPAQHLRLGYTPFWDRFDPDRERPVDVGFLGAYTERRAKLLGSYATALSRRRSELHFSDNTAPNSSTSIPYLADERKWALLERTKVLLNLHQGEEPYFEWLRVIEAMHAGCVVISERSSHYAPLDPGTHLLMGRPASLALLADHLIDDPAWLAAMRLAAYTCLRERLPMRDSVTQLAAAIERAADRSVAGRATHPERHRDRAEAASAPAGETAPSDGSAVRRTLKEAQLQLMEIRRELTGLRHELRTGGTPVTRMDATTSTYRAWPRPRVSILIPLYNHAEHIGAALDSITGGAFNDFELLVVNDGSTDRSREVTLQWLSDHDHLAAAVISHPVNRGLPAARNTAIDFARGDSALVLDADNELLPHCLGRLVNALDGHPDAAFAYGILSAFDVIGSRHLLSQYPWEPARLRHTNYIDALALIRLPVLREIGGFTTDRRLYGVEDWDLWATMADGGHSGVFCPEILARYRVSATSMLSLTNVSHTTMYAAMIEHHPQLMAGLVPPV